MVWFGADTTTYIRVVMTSRLTEEGVGGGCGGVWPESPMLAAAPEQDWPGSSPRWPSLVVALSCETCNTTSDLGLVRTIRERSHTIFFFSVNSDLKICIFIVFIRREMIKPNISRKVCKRWQEQWSQAAQYPETRTERVR